MNNTVEQNTKEINTLRKELDGILEIYDRRHGMFSVTVRLNKIFKLYHENQNLLANATKNQQN